MIEAVLSKLWRLWSRFWFEADGRAQIRAFRPLFGALLIGCYLIRTLDLELFYGEKGIMPLSILADLAPMDYRWSIFRWLPGDGWLWAGNLLFLAALTCFTLGFRPRLSAVVAWALHVSFVHRDLAIAYGVDMISCFFLFFLCFADYREDAEYRGGDLQATLGSVFYRLFQLQICIIYGYSGLKKLKGSMWWSGDAIWASLADPQLARWDFAWAAHFPLLMAAAAWTTVLWEIYFPAAVWNPRLRPWWLAVGVLLHLGIATALALPFFAALMVITYVFFLDRQTLESARAFIRRQRRERELASGAGRLSPQGERIRHSTPQVPARVTE